MRRPAKLIALGAGALASIIICSGVFGAGPGRSLPDTGCVVACR